nr:hypothetical protein [Deltaproteobacteria bacterium]
MKRPLPIVIALGLAFPVGCGPGAADEPSPGRETGACVENECLGDLMCLSDLCVDPTATPTGGTDGGATSDGSSGNLDDTGSVPVPK